MKTPTVRPRQRRVPLGSLVLVAACLTIVGTLPNSAVAGAATSDPANAGVQSSLLRAWNGAGWLSERLGAGVPLENWGSPDWGVTLDAAIAVAAVDRAMGSSHEVLATVRDEVVAHRDDMVVVNGADDPGRLSKAIILATDMRMDPSAVGSAPGADLVARLLATIQRGGPDAGLFGAAAATYDGAYRQGLAIRALSEAGAEVPAEAVDWLVAQQCDDGSWMPYRADLETPCVLDKDNFTGPETNSTAAAVDGLHVSRRDDDEKAARARDMGAKWLESVQNDDGGWGFFEGDAGDANSTAVVTQALVSVGGFRNLLDDSGLEDSGPAAILRGTSFLGTLQIPCDAAGGAGAFGFLDAKSPDLLATSQAVASLAFDGSLTAEDRPAADAGLEQPTGVCVATEVTVPPATVPSSTMPPATVPPSTVPPSTVPPNTVSPDPVATVAGATDSATGEVTSTASGAALATTGTGMGPALLGVVLLLVGLVLTVISRGHRRGPGLADDRSGHDR